MEKLGLIQREKVSCSIGVRKIVVADGDHRTESKKVKLGGSLLTVEGIFS